MTTEPGKADDDWHVEFEFEDGPEPTGTVLPSRVPEPDDAVIAEAEARFDSLSQALDDQLSAIEKLTSAMDVLQTKHSSEDGTITVTVDASGLMNGLALTEEALASDPGALAHQIVLTSRSAAAEHTAKLERTKELIAQFRPPRRS